MSLGGESIIRRRPGGFDGFGNPTASTVPDLPLSGCAVYPRGSTEDSGRSATVVVGYTLLIPDTTVDIVESDQVIWRGQVYEVEGEPGIWPYFDGTDAGLQVAMKRGKN